MKRYECHDCELGVQCGGCSAPFEDEDTPPTECPYENGTECEWILVEHNSPKAESENSTPNKQSLQLPNYKEVWANAWSWYSDRVENGEILGWEFQRILYEFLYRQQ